MSRTEWYRDHAVWKALEALGPELDRAAEKASDSATAVERVSQFRTILAFAGKRLASVDPFLVTDDVVDGLAQTLGDASTSVRSFIKDGQVDYLSGAGNSLSQTLKLLAQLNLPITPSDFVALKESAESYRLAADRLGREAIEQASAVKAELSEVRQRLTELADVSTRERQRLLGMAGEFQTQFAQAQDTRQSEHAQAQAERDQRTQDALTALAAALAEQQQTAAAQVRDAAEATAEQLAKHKEAFEAAQAAFGARLTQLETDATALIEERATALKQLLAEAGRQQRDQLEKLSAEFAQGAAGIRDEVLRRKKEIEDLAGVIANTGMTSGYQQVAKEAKILSRIWQGVTVASMLGFIWLAYEVFLPSIGNDFHWPAFAGRVFVALSVGVLAAYAGAQADRQQKAERDNRQLALELQAIGPFIATLPKDRQDEFLLKIGERSFGRRDGAKDEKSPTSTADIAASKELRGLLTDALRSARGS